MLGRLVCYNVYGKSWLERGALVLPILFSVVVISLSGVMQPGIMFAMTIAKSYRSPLAGIQIAIGHAVVEVPPDTADIPWLRPVL